MVNAIYIYDIGFLVLFTLFVIIFLYRRRKNLKKEGIMYLYRTSVGIKVINYIGTKYKKTIKVLGILGIISGYCLMISIIYIFYKTIYIYLFNEQIVQAIKIPPVFPLIPYVPEIFKISFLPPFYFTYWIIAIAVIAIFHEFAHGIVARTYNVKIKTTGFGFLGPFLAAFVEPDEKQMNKKPKNQQLAILAAGTFTNLILAILFFILLVLFFKIAYIPAGAVFNMYTPEIVSVNSIQSINDIKINNLNSSQLLLFIQSGNIKDEYVFGKESTINLTKVVVNNKTDYIDIDNLKKQLKSDLQLVYLYKDMPALEVGLKGVIIQVNDKKVNSYTDLSNIMKDYKPGDRIMVNTRFEDKTYSYDLVLGEDENAPGRGVMGIVYVTNKKTGVFSKIVGLSDFFKEKATDYQPKFNKDLTIFLNDLIWWLALINISVALMNMLPVGIFDGGRFFMLTIWIITKNEKIAMKAFKIATYLLLVALLLLMIGWARAIWL